MVIDRGAAAALAASPGRRLLVAGALVAVAVACPAPEERRAIDVGAWPIEQGVNGEPVPFVVGDLAIQYGSAAPTPWQAGQASQNTEIEVPSHDRFYARGGSQFGTTRTLGVAEQGRWYRTLYLAKADALLCFALPLADAMRWEVPTAEISTGSGNALVDCAWDASGVRLHVATSAVASFDWSLDLSGPRQHTTSVADGHASLIDLLPGLRPGSHGLQIVARDGSGAPIGSWPGTGAGRLLLLPALLDAVDGGVEFIQDSAADFEAPLVAGGQLLEVTARHRPAEGALYLRIKVSDSSLEPGDPIDVPALGTADTIAVMLRAEVPDAPLVRAAVGRSATLAPASSAGVSAASDGADPWRVHLTVPHQVLSTAALGKNDVVRLCVHCYLDSSATPRLPTAVWPSGCDVDSSRWAAVRLFAVAP